MVPRAPGMTGAAPIRDDAARIHGRARISRRKNLRT